MSTGGGRPKTFKPRNVAVAGRELAVAWADDHESYYPFGALRRDCPCALCRAEMERAATEGPLRLVRGGAPERLDIVRVFPVGAYALQIVWSDGHDSGIYSFEALRRACRCGECAGLGGTAHE